MIKARNIDVCIGQATLLQGVNLQVPPGCLVAVLGANGAGKSTLLRVIAGLQTPSAGSVRVNGRLLREWPPTELARTRAVLRQEVQLSFPLSVLETVLLGRFPFEGREGARQRRRIAEEALQRVGLAHFAQRDVRTLSGGERRRVHFARVLAQLYEPAPDAAKFMLLDEPTAALDIAQQHHLLAMVRQAVEKQGYGALLILHDMNLAAQYADHIVLLQRGRVVEAGAPRAVLTAANIEGAFGIRAHVADHPVYGCPQVTALQPA